MHNVIEKEKKAHYAPQFNVFEEDFLSSFLVLYFFLSLLTFLVLKNHGSRLFCVHLRPIRDVERNLIHYFYSVFFSALLFSSVVDVDAQTATKEEVKRRRRRHNMRKEKSLS
jgi:hypothetical protein